MSPPLRIAIVAGEPSGDNLGAGLIQALRQHYPDAEFFGIAGPRMQAAGCVARETVDSLAVMGLVEIIPHLRRLLRIRRELIERLLANPPDLYIGVDYKEFNLSVERKLKQAGIRTVQYVSPQVWAWRQGRVRKIARSVDLMLCLLPFEKPFYDAYKVNVRFVGHPLADQIPLHTDRAAARVALGVTAEAPCIALLPGSRKEEVLRLSADFARTVAWLSQQRPELCFIAPMASDSLRELFATALQQAGVLHKVKLLEGQAQQAMIASDAVLLTSGTATLEAALVKRPMVVVYRASWFTTFLMIHLGLLKAPFFSQPNLLSGRKLVPEYLNDQVRADILGPELLRQLARPDRVELEAEFLRMHLQLRQEASATAAQAIKELLSTSHG